MAATSAELRERLHTKGCEEGFADALIDVLDAVREEAAARNGAAAEHFRSELARHEAGHDEQSHAILDEMRQSSATVDQRFDEMRQRFDEMRKLFAEAEQRNDQRFDKVDQRLAELTSQIAETRKELGDLRVEHEQRFNEVEKSISRVREEQERRFGEIRADNERRFGEFRDEQARRLSQLRVELAELRVENEQRVGELRGEMGAIAVKMTDRLLYVGLGLGTLILGATGAIIGAIAAFSG